MVTVRVQGVVCSVASKWDDVDFNKLLTCETSKDELKALSNIPHAIIDEATELQLFPLYTIISFIHESELLPYKKADEIRKQSYIKFETAKIALKKGKPYQRLIGAGLAYYPDEKNPVHLVGYGLDIIKQIADFLESYSDMLKDEPEPNAIKAGVSELEAFSYWATAYNLAGRDILKMEGVLQTSLIRVQTAIYYNWKERKYQERKFKLDHPPKKGH